MGASTAIKTALYNAISGLGYTTFTVNPQLADGGADTNYPHVQIGTVAISPWDTKTELGHDFTARVFTRWRGGSMLPGLAIQDALYTALHHGSLTMTGFRVILLEREASNVTQLSGSFEGLCEFHGLITTA